MNIPALPSDLNGFHIHCVGIKGTGVAALVEILHARGAVITGSDVSERFYTDEILEKLKITPLSFDEKNITDSVQLVIYSSAYSPDTNPDLKEAKKRGIPLMLYTQALGAFSKTAFSCGVCGVHGKTTTTGLCGSIFKELELPGAVLAGSIISSFGGCTYTSPKSSENFPLKNPVFIAETCEYQRHFMSFSPQKIILTSVESDHQDYYPAYEDIRSAFVDYICLLPEGGQLIYCTDDKGAEETARIAAEKRPDLELVPYGEKAEGPWHLEFGRIEGGKQYFKIGQLGEFALTVPGKHNVRNSTAAVALNCELLKACGKDPSEYAEKIKKGLLNFRGGRRRSEIVGRAKTPLGQEVIFIDDYAHHPTAIKTTLEGFRNFYRGYKILVDFMSHTYTRTAALLEEFASSFGAADSVIINKIYGSARENPSSASVTGQTLAERAKQYHADVTYCGEFDEASETAFKMLQKPSGSRYPEGYIFVTMGAGNNWQVGTKLLEKLGGAVSSCNFGGVTDASTASASKK